MKSIELRLDSEFICTELETISYTLTVFPGGEINFRLLGDSDQIIDSPCRVWITQRIKNSDDLMKILMATDCQVIMPKLSSTPVPNEFTP